MTRLMSYAMTTPQIQAREKLVTRRDGWPNLKVGEIYWAVKKSMGLKKGETVERLALLQCVGNRRERLYKMIADPEYGKAECILEGFPDMTPAEFVEMYVKAKKGRHAGDEVSRIEFRYVLKAGPSCPEVITVPEKIATCPLCGGKIYLHPEKFHYYEDGTLACIRFGLSCWIDMEYVEINPGNLKMGIMAPCVR